MPRELSGMRIARSFVTPAGAEEVERTLDFQLGADDGIKIFGVQGYGSYHDDTPATSDTVVASSAGHQTLHFETGATEDLPDIAAEDADDIDTEIFFVQWFHQFFQVPATAGGGGGGAIVVPTEPVWFPKGDEMLSPRNITHKGTTVVVGTFGEFGVLIFFKYVRFTASELGVILSRRQ